jgi:hypothetical protein
LGYVRRPLITAPASKIGWIAGCDPHEYRAFTDDVLRGGKHEQRTTSMTALQDRLSFRQVDQNALRQLVCRSFRAVRAAFDVNEEGEELKLLTPGVERC